MLYHTILRLAPPPTGSSEADGDRSTPEDVEDTDNRNTENPQAQNGHKEREIAHKMMFSETKTRWGSSKGVFENWTDLNLVHKLIFLLLSAGLSRCLWQAAARNLLIATTILLSW